MPQRHNNRKISTAIPPKERFFYIQVAVFVSN